MGMTAVLFDLLQFLFTLFVFTIPLAWLSSMFAVVLFWLWFLVLGVSYMSGRKAGLKMATALSAVIVELVPVVQALPGTLVGVIGVIVISRLEDVADATRKHEAAKQEERAQMAQQAALVQAHIAEQRATRDAEAVY